MTIFTDNITSIHGDIGRKWLCDLDSIDPIHIAQWTFVKSVLCWIWSLETPNQDRSELAKLFDKVVGENFYA
ncbi:hypothetical protein FACS189449_13680 [Alphaproteobacteria bacterium]|nr:hypothetical protein FACS189449_13680 [Alphaproteobacteria bacterium]